MLIPPRCLQLAACSSLLAARCLQLALFFLRFRDFSCFSLLAYRPFFVWVAIFSGQPEIATKTKYKYKAIEFPAPFRAYNSIDHLGGGEKHRRPILMLPAL